MTGGLTMYSKDEINDLREKYPERTRIVLDFADDKYAVESGIKGEILGINEQGNIFVLWQDGSVFAIDTESASFHIENAASNDPSEKYFLLYGECSEGNIELRNVNDVAKFICEYGINEDVRVFTPFREELLDTFGIYLNKISDMEYRDELLKVFVPMQQKLDGTANIEETEGLGLSM